MGVAGVDILNFCAETNPAKYFEQSMPAAEDGAVDAEPAETYSAPAECFIQSASITASNPMNSAELSGVGSPLLSPKQRLLLCSNAYTAMGPINCALNALHKGTGKGGAVTATGTSRCFMGLPNMYCIAYLHNRNAAIANSNQD